MSAADAAHHVLGPTALGTKDDDGSDHLHRA
jgi:hypothetical protein